MKKFIGLIIALTGFSLASLLAQSPSPAASPETSPTAAKHRHSKKEASPAATAATAESPAASPEASPSVAKHKRSKKEASMAATTSAAAAPAAASPSPAKHSWFGSKTVSPAPATSPAAATSTAKTTKAVEPAGAPVPGGGPGTVWVNTETHVYHKEGSRWYGRTKKGKYMSEQDALKEGDHADKEEAKAKKQL
jgi:hypothetical protein